MWNFVARGYENNIKVLCGILSLSLARSLWRMDIYVQPKPIMQPKKKSKKKASLRSRASAPIVVSETELHVGPDSDTSFIHIKSSDVCNFAGILIFSLLFFFSFSPPLCCCWFFFSCVISYIFSVEHSSTGEKKRAAELKRWNDDERRERGKKKHSNIWLTIAWRSNVSNRSDWSGA